MKSELRTTLCSGRIRRGWKRPMALVLLGFFTAHFYLIPSLYAVTVEEAAGKRERTSPQYYDELGTKAQERRDSKAVPQEKDPRLACMLSLIVPGGGHIYLKEDLKGISFCLLSVVGYSASGYYLYAGLFGDSSDTEKKSMLIVSGLLFVIAAIVHVVGMVEAYNDAIEINEKRFYYGSGRSLSPYVAVVESRRGD